MDKIYLHVKDPFKSKYQLLINGIQKLGIKYEKIPKAFIDYLQENDDVNENLEEYNSIKARKVIIVFDDIIEMMGAN